MNCLRFPRDSISVNNYYCTPLPMPNLPDIPYPLPINYFSKYPRRNENGASIALVSLDSDFGAEGTLEKKPVLFSKNK